MNRFFLFITYLVFFIFLFIFLSLILSLKSNSLDFINFKELLFSLKLSFFTATISSFIAILIAIPVGYIISRKSFFLKRVIDSVLDIPLVLSPVAIGSLLLLFLNTSFGKNIENFFGGIVFTVKAILIAQIFVIFALALRFLKITFDNIDTEYEYISRTLGASEFKTFIKITLPLSYKQIISSYMLVWARAIGEFGATLTLAGATPLKTETLPIAIYLNFASGNFYTGLALIFILIIICFFILYFVKKIALKN